MYTDIFIHPIPSTPLRGRSIYYSISTNLLQYYIGVQRWAGQNVLDMDDIWRAKRGNIAWYQMYICTFYPFCPNLRRLLHALHASVVVSPNPQMTLNILVPVFRSVFYTLGNWQPKMFVVVKFWGQQCQPSVQSAPLFLGY